MTTSLTTSSALRRTRAISSVLLVVAAAACGSDVDSAGSSTSSGATDTVESGDTSTTSSASTTAAAPATNGAATTTPTTPTTSVNSTAPPSSTAPGDTVVDTRAGVEAAQWGDNVTIEYGDGTFTFKSDSLPSHELPDQFLIPTGQPGGDDPMFVAMDTDTVLSAADLEVEIPLNPVYSEEVTETALGQIGVVISGAQLFNDYEDMERSIVAIEDQTVIDGVTFLDACNGHPLATGADYHYHGVPYCITDDIDVAGEHSTILGFVRDGFPVYGNQDVGGVTLTNADLDECSGHFGPTPEFPDGIYHYHLTDDAAPYSIDCYHGVVDDSVTEGGGAPGGGPPGGGPPPGGTAAP